MDFSNFKTGKKANALQFEADVEEVVEKVKGKEKKLVPIQSLSSYKRVYQYCDTCKRGTNFNIILESVRCIYCGEGYDLKAK